MKEVDEILKGLTAKLGNEAFAEPKGSHTPQAIHLLPDYLIAGCEFLHATEGYYFDFLSCITALDNGPDAGTMEIIYNLSSIPYGHQLTLVVTLDREVGTAIPSVWNIWRTASWHEREAYDLMGITFTGHPDHRRILLPTDWEGHPLRKDYEAAEKYHGVTIRY